LTIERLGQYTVLEQISSSNTGDVYRARDISLGRSVAIHILPADAISDDSSHQQFVAAAGAATSLSHPNIAALYEIGEYQGRPFLASEFVAGEPLARLVAGRPLNPRRAIDIATQLADAIADAHASGVVHGDLTAETVIITPRGSAKVLNFGVAPWARRKESYAGRTARTDVVALGGMLFEMLTGRPPSSDRGAAVLPSTVNATSVSELDAIVARALDDAEDYEAVALAADLRTIAGVLDARAPAGKPPTTPPRVPVPRRGRAWTLIVIAAVLALLAILRWLR